MTLPSGQLKFIDGALTVRLCTISSNGVPLITPLWFARDGDTIYLGTRRDSYHARHMARNPRVIMLFSDFHGRRTRRVLRAAGSAKLSAHAQMTPRRKLRMVTRYYLPPASAWHWLRNWKKRATLGRYHDERRDVTTVEIHLESAEFLDQPLP